MSRYGGDAKVMAASTGIDMALHTNGAWHFALVGHLGTTQVAYL